MLNRKSLIYICLLCFFISGCSSKASNNKNISNESSRSVDYTNQPEAATKAKLANEIKATEASTKETKTEATTEAKQPETEATQKVVEFLNSYTTNFDSSKTNRISNIKLASKQINDIIIGPNEIFSFNETVGPMGEKEGYKKAVTYVNGQEKENFGGGVCQVSTTIFNAVNQLGVKIVERHNHSHEVPYAENGNDAAVSYGGADFKFKNTNPYSLQLNIDVKEKTITVSVSKVEYK